MLPLTTYNACSKIAFSGDILFRGAFFTVYYDKISLY